MSITNQQQKIQSTISIMQQAKNSMQNAWSMVANSASSSLNTVFQAQMSGSNNKVNGLANKLSGLTQGTEEYSKVERELQVAQNEAYTSQNAAFGKYQALQMSMVGINQAANSIFAAGDEVQMNVLQQQDSQLELEKESVESQLQLLNAEYDSVKKAEGEAAKNAAPQFVA